MARIEVKITKTCSLGLAGNIVNIKEGQLHRFEGCYELVKEEKKKPEAKKKESGVFKKKK